MRRWWRNVKVIPFSNLSTCKFLHFILCIRLLNFRPFKIWLERDTNCSRLSSFNENSDLSTMIPERILPTVANMQLDTLTSMTEDVILIGAPTGSGKSVAVCGI